jgi:hypothetical protein
MRPYLAKAYTFCPVSYLTLPFVDSKREGIDLRMTAQELQDYDRDVVGQKYALIRD